MKEPQPSQTPATRSFEAERAYLINVAEAIQQQLLPQLSGQAQARALDCINVTLRVAASVGDPAKFCDAPAAGSDTLQEARRWDSENGQFAKLLDAVTGSKPRSRPDLKPENVQAYLRGHALGASELRVLEAKLLPGGRSKLTAIVAQEGSSKLPRDLVIRQDWMALAGSSVCSEFGLLKKLWEHDIKVPRPFIIEPDAAVLGAPFMIVARLNGQQHGNILTPPAEEALVFGAAEMLGRLHALRDIPFDALPDIVERNFTAAQLAAKLAAFRGVIEQLHLPRSPLLGEALDWLEHTVNRVSGPRVLVHGDYGFHNLLFDGPDLSAVLDWELSHLGNPAYDLGYLRAVVDQRVEWGEFLKRYRAAGGPEVDAFAVDWYALFTAVWLYQILLQARAGLVAGVLHDIEITSVCAHIGPPLLIQIASLLQRAVREHNLGDSDVR